MIEFGNASHVGLRRELNEDTYYSDGELGLWLVADGMGGHEFGEVASALARDSVVREVRSGRTLSEAIRSADEEIIRESRKRADSLPMGTTMVALRVVDNRFELAWVGDSRAYLWNGQLRQPMLLTDGQGVISQAPIEGLLHPSNVLDTLGADAPEKRCKTTR